MPRRCVHTVNSCLRLYICVFLFYVTALNRSSRKRDRFTVRPSDYISDSVTAPSSTATVCVCLTLTHHKHTHLQLGSTCWLHCLTVHVLAGWDRPAWVLSWGRVLAIVINRHLYENNIKKNFIFSCFYSLIFLNVQPEFKLINAEFHNCFLKHCQNQKGDVKIKVECVCVPEVRAGSSWGGWEGEGEGEELHRCNPDREGRGAGLQLQTDSSHEQTVRRALQSVSEEEKRSERTWTPQNTHANH